MQSDSSGTDRGPIKVFISYSRVDIARAKRVIAGLEQHGFDVWWDGLLEGGVAFANTTEQALESADAVVVLWSDRSVQSHWVRDEASYGRDHGRLVPLSLDGTAPPLGFRQIQYINFKTWKGKANAPEFATLTKAVEATAAAPNAQVSPTAIPAPAAGPRIGRRGLLIGGGALAAVGAGLAVWKGGLIGSGARTNSIAVLALRNLSGDPGQDYFSAGLSEELRTTLSLNRQLEVAARTSSDSFRGTDKGAQAIAAALGVAFVLEGSVRSAAGKLRITVQLIDGRSGFETWSQSYDREVADVLAVQREIAVTVTDMLVSRIAGEDTVRAVRVGGTQDPEAFDAYLRGQELYVQSAGETSQRAALGLFEKAIAIDPGYAAAHAARARMVALIANNYGQASDLRAATERALGAARKAVELAPDLAEGHAALGFILMTGTLDLAAAAAPYRKSYELGFGNAQVLASFSEFAANTGAFADGRAAVARATRFDPLNFSVFRSAGILEYSARDYAAARQPLQTALGLNPKTTTVRRLLGDLALFAGKPDEARTFYLAEPSPLGRLRSLAIVDRQLAGPAAGEAQLRALIDRFGDNSLYQQAQVMAQWGRPDAALALLERALTIRDSGLVLAKSDPMLDPIRQQPRFQAVLHRLGLA